jgi:hypothetical protein
MEKTEPMRTKTPKIIEVPRRLFEEILRQAEEHHPRPHYADPLVPCGGPGVCMDEINFALARKILDQSKGSPTEEPAP